VALANANELLSVERMEGMDYPHKAGFSKGKVCILM
jgi:hypothetical protein